MVQLTADWSRCFTVSAAGNVTEGPEYASDCSRKHSISMIVYTSISNAYWE